MQGKGQRTETKQEEFKYHASLKQNQAPHTSEEVLMGQQEEELMGKGVSRWQYAHTIDMEINDIGSSWHAPLNTTNS